MFIVDSIGTRSGDFVFLLKGMGGYALDNLNSLYTTIFSTICDPRKGMKGVFGGVLRVWGIGDAFDVYLCSARS
jgi:hypothetical protein